LPTSALPVYECEIFAICMALMAVPVSQNVCIHSDAQSVVAQVLNHAIPRGEAYIYEEAVRKAIHIRRARGGSTEILHVKAHTTGQGMLQVGNRIADAAAKAAHKRSINAPVGLDIRLFCPRRVVTIAGSVLNGPMKEVFKRMQWNAAKQVWLASRSQSPGSEEMLEDAYNWAGNDWDKKGFALAILTSSLAIPAVQFRRNKEGLKSCDRCQASPREQDLVHMLVCGDGSDRHRSILKWMRVSPCPVLTVRLPRGQTWSRLRRRELRHNVLSGLFSKFRTSMS